MPDNQRRQLPDNLDPLVDTLSNVVGILVVVVALTQLQVGDAIERLIELDATRLPSARRETHAIERAHADLSERLAAAQARREAILIRSNGDIGDAIDAAERAIATLDAQPGPPSAAMTISTDTLSRELQRITRELEVKQQAMERRESYAEEIRRVPKELVARLPDPTTVTGEEAWILCRYGRCFPADRRALMEIGSRVIGEILLSDERPRGIRLDEFESVAHHFRKRDIGAGDFRWTLVPGSPTVAQLEWRSKDAGIHRTQLATSRELAGWLAERRPDQDFIRFQVWNDSFEVYLEAREVIESAGFRAGWEAFSEDAELEFPVSFGPAQPRTGPVEVD